MPHRRRLLAAPALLLALGACNNPAGNEASDGKPAGAVRGEGLSLAKAVDRLQVAPEHGSGYDREKFHHWIDEDSDGCDTRAEILLSEAVSPPEQGDNCRLTGGRWTSYYDGERVSDASDLDIDHMVPLSQAWASGAHEWDAKKREAYANDLKAQQSLVAVTASTNRSKSDKDPAQWMPPAKSAHCRYAADWVATKLRWALAADEKEKTALGDLASNCRDTSVSYTPAS